MTNTLELAKSNGHAQAIAHTDGTHQMYTFPSSGIEVTIQRVSQQRAIDHRNAMQRRDEAHGIVPQPPKQTLDIAGELVTQTNTADPEYIAKKQVYDDSVAERQTEWFVSRTLVIDSQLVADYRARTLAEDGTDYAERPDWYIFLWHIACLNPSDYSDFYFVAASLSVPTPAAIADAKSRF